ncbi:MAG: hypothetical protein KDD70_05270 [Bdellovibrionales bacterium]|nr:hypothetical protein [Bdellovibrionales bacterium]
MSYRIGVRSIFQTCWWVGVLVIAIPGALRAQVGVEGLVGVVPVSDLPAAAVAQRYVAEKALDAVELQLNVTASTKGETPAQHQGLTGRLITGRSGQPEYKRLPQSFEEGADLASIALRMFEDFTQMLIAYYSGAGEYTINGLCYKPLISFAPYQEYRIPYGSGEIASTSLRGSYLDNLIVRPAFKALLEDGPLAPIISRDGVQLVNNFFESSDGLAPLEVNRMKALTQPDSDGEQYSPLQRTFNRVAEMGGRGEVPRTPDEIEGFHGYRGARSRGEHGTFRNLEFHRFSNLVDIIGSSALIVPFGQCHAPAPIMEEVFPFIHRSDNPLFVHFNRSQEMLDLYLLLKGKQEKVSLATTPGLCVAYDIGHGRGPLESLGISADSRFGLLSGVNRGLSGAGALAAHASRDNCLLGAGSIYPLNNRVQGGKNFSGNFYTRFLRADKFTGLVTDNQLPSFHRYSGGGSRYASKLQLLRGSLGRSGPEVVQPGRWKDPWRDSPSEYATDRAGARMDLASYAQWQKVNCCPRGFSPIVGPSPQIFGSEVYTGDGWN